jgi:hypothetical protein
MKTKKIVLIFILALTLVLFTTPRGWAQIKPGTHSPIITHPFAVEKGYDAKQYVIVSDAILYALCAILFST